MVNNTSIIDPHVHLRGLEYPKHDFRLWAFEDAMAVGIEGIGEQPNPNPQLTSPEAVGWCLQYSSLYAQQHKVKHWIHIGMTNDMAQNERSLRAIMERRFDLVSDKTFNTHSTGNMGITSPEKRRDIWILKGKIVYKGVSITHCEDEARFTGRFDWTNPISHSQYQNEEAEVVSIEETLRNAYDSKFQGTLYFAHVSSPLSTELIKKFKREVPNIPFNIETEITWHHMLLNTNDYGIHGNRVKMNPPLRDQKSQEENLENVLQGEYSVIGSDHAPHLVTDEEKGKDSPKPPSGIQAIPFYPKGREILSQLGMKPDRLNGLLFDNTNRIFGLNLTPREVDVEYNPSLWKKYGCNPFSRVDGTI